jgi:hypothetical protein
MLQRITASLATPLVVAVTLALIVYGLVLGFGG